MGLACDQGREVVVKRRDCPNELLTFVELIKKDIRRFALELYTDLDTFYRRIRKVDVKFLFDVFLEQERELDCAFFLMDVSVYEYGFKSLEDLHFGPKAMIDHEDCGDGFVCVGFALGHKKDLIGVSELEGFWDGGR